ncbi:Protein fam86a [Homalodisca vitripennis]|nr:Protein fam86a [Homalodisca vitripennis]
MLFELPNNEFVPDVLAIQKVFFSCSVLTSLDWEEVIKFIREDEDPLIAQNKVLEATVSHPLNQLHPVKEEYQRLFLKKLISQLETCGEEVSNEVYKNYIEKLNTTSELQEHHHRHFRIEGKGFITLQESTRFVTGGTTGLQTWEHNHCHFRIEGKGFITLQESTRFVTGGTTGLQTWEWTNFTVCMRHSSNQHSQFCLLYDTLIVETCITSIFPIVLVVYWLHLPRRLSYPTQPTLPLTTPYENRYTSRPVLTGGGDDRWKRFISRLLLLSDQLARLCFPLAYLAHSYLLLGGLALAEWCIQHSSEITGRRVLELGCGVGLTGLAVQTCAGTGLWCRADWSGCVCSQGGLALAEWCIQHSSEITGRRVLELGCGVGLTGLAVSVHRGGLALAEWCIQHSSEITGKRVLELGCGVGLTGLAVCSQGGLALAEWCIQHSSEITGKRVLELGYGVGLTGLLSVHRGGLALAEWCIQHSSEITGKRVLELGCGVGLTGLLSVHRANVCWNWAVVSADWSAVCSQGGLALAEWCIQHSSEITGKRVLELGCGVGLTGLLSVHRANVCWNWAVVSADWSAVCSQGGLALAEWCIQYSSEITGKRVLELGCGVGLTGLAGGLALAEWCIQHSSEITGKRVLELGCGVGLTGLAVCSQGGLALAEWCIQHSSEITGKRVLELGCGVGLTGLAVCSQGGLALAEWCIQHSSEITGKRVLELGCGVGLTGLLQTCAGTGLWCRADWSAVCSQGGLALAEWCIQHSSEITGKRVLELGCGVGLTGLLSVHRANVCWNWAVVSADWSAVCSQGGLALAEWCIQYSSDITGRRVLELGCGVGLTGLAGGLALAEWCIQHSSEITGRRLLELGCDVGLTGLAVCSQGGLALAEWCIQHSSEITGKRVLELGCGVRLTGLASGLALAEWCIQHSSEITGKRVLELGCGVGLTGLAVCSQGGLALAEWCIQHSSEITGKRVLELGCGVGLTGLAVCSQGGLALAEWCIQHSSEITGKRVLELGCGVGLTGLLSVHRANVCWNWAVVSADWSAVCSQGGLALAEWCIQHSSEITGRRVLELGCGVGLTGLAVCSQGGLALAEWCIQHSSEITGRRVLELGCGVGLTGLAVCSQGGLALAEWCIQHSSEITGKRVLELGCGVRLTGLAVQTCAGTGLWCRADWSGCVCSQGGLALAEWCIQHSSEITGRRVLELGCGVGLTGLAVCSQGGLALAEWCIQHSSEITGKRVLELGCGVGLTGLLQTCAGTGLWCRADWSAVCSQGGLALAEWCIQHSSEITGKRVLELGCGVGLTGLLETCAGTGLWCRADWSAVCSQGGLALAEWCIQHSSEITGKRVLELGCGVGLTGLLETCAGTGLWCRADWSAVCSQGGLALAEWCIQHSSEITGKRVLELGCGVGLTGLLQTCAGTGLWCRADWSAVCSQGGLALAEWCIQHSSEITGKRVLELGCGVGLTGLLSVHRANVCWNWAVVSADWSAVCSQGGLALAEWCIQHSSEITGKRLLELGCDVGLTGLAVCSQGGLGSFFEKHLYT